MGTLKTPQMAGEVQARILTLPWSQNGKRGTFKAALGTVEFLGIPLTAGELGEVSYPVGAKTISRRMYPGGPVLTYNRPAQTIRRVVGGGVSTARSSSKLILRANNTTDTVYYTGPLADFCDWLRPRMQASESVVELLTPHGNALIVVDRRAGLAA